MTHGTETIDPRWNRLIGQSWKCASCALEHRGIFDLGCAKPDPFPGAEDYAPNSVVATSSHGLSEDFCVLDGQHYFVRCVLALPLIGLPDQLFAFGIWSTLSKKNFALYTDSFDSGEQASLGPWFGWFSNRLKGYPDTFNLKCQVHPQGGRTRPWLELEETNHPLARESRDGVPFDRMLEIYSLYGHSIG